MASRWRTHTTWSCECQRWRLRSVLLSPGVGDLGDAVSPGAALCPGTRLCNTVLAGLQRSHPQTRLELLSRDTQQLSSPL